MLFAAARTILNAKVRRPSRAGGPVGAVFCDGSVPVPIGFVASLSFRESEFLLRRLSRTQEMHLA